MAFIRQDFGRGTQSYNTTAVFMYESATDTKVIMQTADYFVSETSTLKVNDWILAVGSDGATILIVATVDKITPALTVTVLI